MRLIEKRRFKTPGSAPVNVETGGKILVMDEATRMKLIEKRRQALLAIRAQRETAESESSHSGTKEVQRCTSVGSVDGQAKQGILLG
jgi:hypothetical protein